MIGGENYQKGCVHVTGRKWAGGRRVAKPEESAIESRIPSTIHPHTIATFTTNAHNNK